jgi:hypothetical protein
MSTGASQDKQSRSDQSGGGNSQSYDKNTLHQPPNFLDKSGQSDNASTSRPKGQAGS